MRYHFIQEKVKAGDIRVDYVNTLNNPADLLSKMSLRTFMKLMQVIILGMGPWIAGFEIREGDKIYGIL